MKLILLRIPDEAWPKFRRAAADSFGLEDCTDAEVVQWVFLNLGVDVFGEGAGVAHGNLRLAELGVTIAGPDTITSPIESKGDQ